MIDFALTDDHDLEITDDIQMVDGADEVLSAVKVRLLWIRGEWVFNFLLGIPWLTDMLDIRYPQQLKRAAIVDTIRETGGVDRIFEFEYSIDPEARGALVTFRGRTIFGPIQAEIAI